MIGVEEAKGIIIGSVQRTATDRMELNASAAHYSAVDITSPHDHPLFDMSAVDGYAFACGGANTHWQVVDSVAAGEVFDGELKEGDCVRIFTGAMIPHGADTVVMQEYVTRNGDRITHNDAGLKRGRNVRRKGEQLRTGDPLLGAGARISAAAVGLLASAGIRSISVHRKPRVNIVRTGGEFTDGAGPAPGRIFSSNDAMLVSALRSEGITPLHEAYTPADEPDELRSALRSAMVGSDVVITTGGVSVGEHDLVRSTLEELGATILFHGVRQKPGKPMLFAKLGGTHVFALPGNPRAVLVAWWEYVLPCLRAMQGEPSPWPERSSLPCTHAVQVKGDRAEFRAARIRNGTVTFLPDEGSHMLRSLLDANALAFLSEDVRSVNAGDLIEVHHIPHG